jgi:hypothetical protein
MTPNEKEKKVEERREEHGELGKKPYISPTLTNHGDVEEITKVLRLADVRKTENSPSVDNFL